MPGGRFAAGLLELDMNPMATDRRKVSLVIPVYFNEDSLPLLFDKLAWLEDGLDSRSLDLELVFVDDGSLDGSLDRLLAFRQTRPGTKVIKLSRNFGVAAAVKTGFAHITGDCFANVAADLQDPLEKVLELVDHWAAGARFGVCVRESRNDPLGSVLFSKAYYWLLRKLVSRDYPVGGFDIMLLDRQLLPLMLRTSRNVNHHVYAWSLGIKPAIVRYERPRRSAGKSAWTFRKRFNYLIDSLTGFSVTPIRLMLGFGLSTAAVSVLYGAWIVVSALSGRADVAGFPTIVALMTFFGGMTLTLVGIVGEYIWRIFDNINYRPEAVVDEIHDA